MATPTYIPLATVTLAASSSAVFFTEISQDYRDLILVTEVLSTASTVSTYLRFNGDAGENYSWVTAQAQSSADSSAGTTNSTFGGFGDTTVRGFGISHIMDYSATDKHKSVLVKRGKPDSLVGVIAHRWANTAAITSITVFSPSNSYAAGSTFKLFGIHGEVV